jgi:hypothetical protein
VDLHDAQAAEAVLLEERQALKARQQGLAQARKTLSQQRLTPRKRVQEEAILHERQEMLEEQDYTLTQRQQAARVRAGQAAEALKRARRAQGRHGQEG